MATSLQYPPGFRFHPTDEELVLYYLCRKCDSLPVAPIIAEVDFYKFDPWNLPDLALYGDQEWYFFTSRDRKYPNGKRPNRVAGCGYWKATGADKFIGNPHLVAIKKALVFYVGKAPKGKKTDWIMHEYILADVDRSPHKKSNNSKLDDWVLCRLYNKKGNVTTLTNAMEVEQINTVFATPPLPITPQAHNDSWNFDTIDSGPNLYTDASCSEYIVSPTQETQNECQWEQNVMNVSYDYFNAPGVPKSKNIN